MKFRAVEFIQRAEDGGRPLQNETAYALDLGHGDSLLTISKDDLLDWLNFIVHGSDLKIIQQQARQLLDRWG